MPALPTSGPISLNDIHVELGGTSGTTVSFNDADVRGLNGNKANGALQRMDQFRGRANEFLFSVSGNMANVNTNTLATNAGWNGSARLVMTVPSGSWIYSGSTGSPALTVNTNETKVINYGKIIGKGGNGGRGGYGGGGAGGPAIQINNTNCTIQNQGGAYIAGGGGGGGGGQRNGNGGGGGGGGAGGGNGGPAKGNGGGGGGGGLNASGGNGYLQYGHAQWNHPDGGAGGGAGGGGGNGWGSDQSGSGGGGGRILPGSGGQAGHRDVRIGNGGGRGGSGGGAGAYGSPTDQGSSPGGGGGGWGANGGGTPWYGGGSGGKAVNTSQSYTLTNSGTVYGGT